MRRTILAGCLVAAAAVFAPRPAAADVAVAVGLPGLGIFVGKGALPVLPAPVAPVFVHGHHRHHAHWHPVHHGHWLHGHRGHGRGHHKHHHGHHGRGWR